jgi:hypothetical protein
VIPADGAAAPRRLIILVVAVAAVVLVTAAVAVLETAVAARLVGPALLLLELPQAAITEAGYGDADSAVVAGGIGGTVRTGAAGRAGVPSTAGVAEGEALIGTVRAGALTVLWIQTATDLRGTGVGTGGCRRSATRGAGVAAEGLSVSAVLVPLSAHLADWTAVAKEGGRGDDRWRGSVLFICQTGSRLGVLLVEGREADRQGCGSGHGGREGGLKG